MAEGTPTPHVKYRIGGFSAGLILGITSLAHIIMLVIALIPGVDLIDWVIWLLVDLPIKLFFILHLGLGGYLGGKKSTQKVVSTIVTTVVGLVPILDGLVPVLIIESAVIIFSTRAEDREKAVARAQAEQAVQEQQLRAQQIQEATIARKRLLAQVEAARAEAANDNEEERQLAA